MPSVQADDALSSCLSFLTAQVQDCIINILALKAIWIHGLYPVCPLGGTWWPCLGHCLHRICQPPSSTWMVQSPHAHLLTLVFIFNQLAIPLHPSDLLTDASTYLVFGESLRFLLTLTRKDDTLCWLCVFIQALHKASRSSSSSMCEYDTCWKLLGPEPTTCVSTMF